MFRARPNSSVRLKSRPKSKPLGRSRITTRETSPRSAKPHATPTAHDQSARAGKKPRGRATVRVPADASVRAGKERPASGREFHRPNLIRSTTPDRPNPSDPDRSDSATTRCPADRPDDRPNAAVDPKPFLKPKLMFSSPA
ncbi:unnamed protein product [Microthlaspi erraticum]|uniref:Uncharacterized protein n=1 Tax=Microthlaspi erraticum TaxID=1685480 RepID=A0A6D2I5H8_9BRAS|nr:unnamed protein product [Microthlaspi erraticum]